MPESTCLHIQDCESGPIRVVELPWISVRIGRAAYCEIRLPDAQVADEACRLTRRGRTWSLVPSSGRSPILLEGHLLKGPCPLPFDVPFRMGPYCLILRQDIAAEPNWELYPAQPPVTRFEQIPAVEPAAIFPAVAELPSAATEQTAAMNRAGRSARPAADPDRWRARWKAAESHFKSRAARLDAGGQRPDYATTSDVLRETNRSLFTPSASRSTPIEPPARPVPPPAAPRIEAAWIAPRLEPSPPNPRIEPPPRPRPGFGADRPAAVASTPPEAVVTPESHRAGTVAGDDISRFPITENPTQPVEETVIATDSPPTVERGDAVDAERMEDHPQSVPVITPDATSSPEPEPAPAERPMVDLEPATDETRSTAREADPERLDPLDGSAATRETLERIGGRALREPSPRTLAEPSERTAGRDRPTLTESELPSVRDILVNHRNSAGPRPAVERTQRARRAVPTVPLEPGQWSAPGWLALPPLGAVTLAVGLLACVLSWWWAADASTAAILTQRLLATDGTGRRRPVPPELTPAGGRWFKSTAQHLAHWAIYTANADNDDAHPPSAAPMLVSRALEISPLNPTARLAMAQLEAPGRDASGRIRGLGLSRDSVSLAWSARRLMDAGKKEAALRVYSRSLSAAVDSGLSRSATPRFADDPVNPRYFLPAEDAVRDIVSELASRQGLEFREWSRALPRHPTVVLATARLLRERGASEAESLIDELLGDNWVEAGQAQDHSLLTAARAEALMLRSRWKEAAYQYRQAIEEVDNDVIRRSWWFNLADVARQLNDEGQRQSAYRAVLAAQSSDDISRRVSQIQRSADAKPRTRERYGSLMAN